MAAKNTLRSHRIDSIHAELPAGFNGERATDEQIGAALDRYAESGAISDRDALVSLLLPQVVRRACLKLRKGAANSELDDLISDGAAAVADVAQRHAGLPLAPFVRMISSAIKCSFQKGISRRTWGGGKKPGTRDYRTMQQIKSIFIKQHGRLPKGNELIAAWDRMIENGQIEKDLERKAMIPLDATDEDAVSLLAQLASSDYVGPVYETLDRERMQLAMRTLTGIDRKLFTLAIQGLNNRQIGERLHIHPQTVFNRVNGLLWQARCRADLAAYMGVEAFDPAKIPLNKAGKPIAISQVPPARLVG